MSLEDVEIIKTEAITSSKYIQPMRVKYKQVSVLVPINFTNRAIIDLLFTKINCVLQIGLCYLTNAFFRLVLKNFGTT